MQKRYLLFLASIFLASCHAAVPYRRYYGNMAMTSFSLPYASIRGKEIVSDALYEREPDVPKTDDEEPSLSTDATDYYTDIFVLTTQAQVDGFFKNESLSYSQQDYQAYSFLPSDLFYVILISQIPEGYQAYKRENVLVQGSGESSHIISENFYCLASHPEINYFFIDLKEGSFQGAHVQSFLFSVDIRFRNDITESTIRPIYSF